MKVWISKYALTKGIYQVEGKTCEDSGSPGMFVGREYFHGEGKQWHRTEREAVHRAEDMRAAKLVNLKKQIAKLERMEF